MTRKNKKIKILFAASEAAPFVKVGGLGDVAGSLPSALAETGLKIALILPRYETIPKKYRLKPIVKNFAVSGGKDGNINVYRLTKDEVDVFFVENKKYLSRGPVYFERTALAGSFKEIQRFLFFSLSVFKILASGKLPYEPDVIHAHDWHTGALVSFLKKSGFPAKNVFTIHNLENQGAWNAKAISNWFSGMSVRADFFREFGEKFNFMAEGIINADIVTTVSPSYSAEIGTVRYGAGLEKIISGRRSRPIGILNGIDYDFYNPETDRLIWPNYSAKTLNQGKEKNKVALQKFCGLNIGTDKPIFGVVSRLTGQKGIKLSIPLIKDLAEKHDAQFVFLGQGEKILEEKLTDASRKYGKNVFVKIGFDEELAHKIYAASDFFLMPSLFEPCGLGQMIAMRYGAVPIARKTGGLKDTIKDGENGFLFENPDSDSLGKAALRALRLFPDKARLEKFRRRCMKENFSWDKQALKYAKLYHNIANAI